MTQLEQTDRVLRAAQEMDRYTFRRMTMKTSEGPRTIVYVISASGGNYAITEGRHHRLCNCPDYQRRCAGSLAKCKHLIGLEICEEGERRAAASIAENERISEQRRAEARKNISRDFPEFD